MILSTETTVLNNSKSAVWSLSEPKDDEDPLGLSIKPIKDSGSVRLGFPVGKEEYVVDILHKRVEKVETILEKLHQIENPHSEF